MRIDRTMKPTLEMTLCPRCAGVYYNDRTYWIERTDKNQMELEPCTLCSHPHGYDFRIWKLSSVRQTKSHL